jgi:hypothetical protein
MLFRHSRYEIYRDAGANLLTEPYQNTASTGSNTEEARRRMRTIQWQIRINAFSNIELGKGESLNLVDQIMINLRHVLLAVVLFLMWATMLLESHIQPESLDGRQPTLSEYIVAHAIRLN